MSEEVRERYEQALKAIHDKDERRRIEAWAFLMAMKDHFPSLYPSDAPAAPDVVLEPNRFIKQRRIFIECLAKQML